ncbi:hypothetical protein ACE1OC_41315 [Streptomyces sp. DSM 116496]|uniref:hypothetical protein n=1 Tax=Streptomyces stoeckheimensis TaxID=3344656 RepID=UPI0038B26ACC
MRNSDHVNRRTLPLLLAVLLATSGCVSVTPVDNKPPQDRTKFSAPPAPAREAGEALPLTPLPASRPPAPSVLIAPEDTPSAPRTRREQPRTTEADGSDSGVRTVRPERRPVKAKQSSPQRPASNAEVRAKVTAKPRKVRTPMPAVPQRSRPAAVPVANANARASRLAASVQQLESRLSRHLGEQAWQASGLGPSPDAADLQATVTRLEQAYTELKRMLEECQGELDAARSANRDLTRALNQHS